MKDFFKGDQLPATLGILSVGGVFGAAIGRGLTHFLMSASGAETDAIAMAENAASVVFGVGSVVFMVALLASKSRS